MLLWQSMNSNGTCQWSVFFVTQQHEVAPTGRELATVAVTLWCTTPCWDSVPSRCMRLTRGFFLPVAKRWIEMYWN